MKKLLSIALSLSLVLSLGLLTGCSTDEQTTDATPDPSVEAPEATEAPAATETLELIVAHNNTSQESPYAAGVIEFKEVVEEISGGQIQVVLHHGSLGENENELVEKLSMGAVDMVVAAPAFMAGIGVPEIDIFSLLYLFDSFDHWETSLSGEFGTSLKDFILEKTDNDYRVMGYWSSGVRDVYAKQALVTPADAEGLAIRTQDSAVQQQFWIDAGATPTSVAWNELYQALQQGVVDGAENDYTNLRLKDHHNTPNGKFISETHHDYTTRFFMMTGEFYDALTTEQQEWITTASDAATKKEIEVTYAMFEESKAICIEDGVTVTENADMDIQAFKDIAIPIQDEFAAKYEMESYFEMIR